MKEKGVTNDALARLVGSAPGTIAHWRDGLYKPRADQLVKLCESLDCSADELLCIQRKQDARLNRAQATGLYKAVTKNGKLNANAIHQMASAYGRLTGGRITPVERWFRAIAESVYNIEVVIRPNQNPVSPEAVQLTLWPN